jgi:hypothetical protein
MTNFKETEILTAVFSRQQNLSRWFPDQTFRSHYWFKYKIELVLNETGNVNSRHFFS